MNTASPTFTVHNDLPERLRNILLPLLNQQLADTFDLYSQVKQAHWNVKGMYFSQLRLLFGEFASDLNKHVDLIAERAAALGGTALGTARIAAATSRLPEYPVEVVEGRQVIEVLVQRFAVYAATSREAIATASEHGDQATAALFTEVSRCADENLWFLEAHLQG